MPPEHPAGRWLVEIQALRGAAVVGVILHHLHSDLLKQPHRLLDWVQVRLDYWTGVDLFFAISGFVIARSLLPTLTRCAGTADALFEVAIFWLKRGARLLPSAWLWLAIILLATRLFNEGGFFGSMRANVQATICGVLNVANIRFSQTVMRTEYGASFAWWSLSLEEQFYVFLPLAAVLAGRALPFVFVVIVACQMPFARSAYGMMFRTDAIALGVLLAMLPGPVWTSASRMVARIPKPAMAVLTLGLFLMLGVLGTEEWKLWRFRIGGIALISATLVFLAAQDTGRVFGEGLARRCLAWIGTRSYALYLVHVPAMYAVRESCFRLGGASEYVQLALALGLMLLLAEMNLRWVEQPARRHGYLLADRLVQRRNFPEASAHVV